MEAVCSRCGAVLVEPQGMFLVGRPVASRGPRLVETLLCADCCSLLQRFLAGPAVQFVGEPDLVPQER